ncbi:MAG TPA: universal stress protein, partial [Longimicrobiaceae bacterium]|nr:universal stress protein [Longimicrobiaceae bacterium]
VIATHGYGALLRALIGSVASHVARRAPCSVLLVPPNRWAADEPTVDAWAGVARGFVPMARTPER